MSFCGGCSHIHIVSAASMLFALACRSLSQAPRVFAPRSLCLCQLSTLLALEDSRPRLSVSPSSCALSTPIPFRPSSLAAAGAAAGRCPLHRLALCHVLDAPDARAPRHAGLAPQLARATPTARDTRATRNTRNDAVTPAAVTPAAVTPAAVNPAAVTPAAVNSRCR
eukprot:3980113-Pleurochrysis_carterae.AAC.1